jgi:hypothetical protein
MRKVLIALGVLIFLIVIVGVVVLGYFGIIKLPGNIFQVSKPADLGVTSSQEEYQAFIEKTQSQVLPYEQASAELQATNPSIIFTEPKDYEATYTSSEITSRINYASWASMPSKNVQVKFSDGGVIEASGNLITANLQSFATAAGNAGYSDEDVQKGLDWLNKLASDPSFYIKATAEITNNELTLNTQSIKINRIPLPSGQANDALIFITEHLIKSVSGLNAEKATFSDEGYYFKGQAPSVIYSTK